MTTFQDIVEAFELFDDWEDKYRFIIDIGKELPTLDPALRTDAALVRGCQSQVWLHHTVEPDTGEMHFQIDSDAHIVRGLVAIILTIYDNKTPTEITAEDIDGRFNQLDLLRHLSTSRGNGLRAMVERIQQLALSATKA